MIFRVYVYLPEGNWSLVFCWPVDVGGDSLPPRRLPSHSCWPSSRCPYGHCPTNPSDPSAPSVIFSCGKLGSQPTLRWMVGTTMKNAGFTFKKVGFHQGNWDNKCLLRAFFYPLSMVGFHVTFLEQPPYCKSTRSYWIQGWLPWEPWHNQGKDMHSTKRFLHRLLYQILIDYIPH